MNESNSFTTMEETLESAKTVIQQAKHYKQKSDEIARITGGRFNVFSILGVDRRETSTHSAFLTELLNPKGTHDQGDIFLSLFIKMLHDRGIALASGFNTKTTSVRKETRIGLINEIGTEGGQLDILLKDDQRNAICIENKIYAADQQKQLIRYKNHEKGFNSFILLYLTLNGNSASDYSAEHLKSKEDYHCISYRNDILGWLEECREAVVDVPIVREAIGQYIHLIKKLTNQTMDTDDREALVNWVIENDRVDVVKEMQGLWEDIHLTLVTKLLDILKNRELQYGLKLTDDSIVIRNPSDSIDFRFKKQSWDYSIRAILYPALCIGVYKGLDKKWNSNLKAELDNKLGRLNLGEVLNSWTSNSDKSTWIWITKVEKWKQIKPREIPTEGVDVIIDALYKLVDDLEKEKIELTTSWNSYP